LAPTLLFAVIVPRILALYRNIAVRLTDWEDHATEASYQNALTVKTLCVALLGLSTSRLLVDPQVYSPLSLGSTSALNSIVAFGGLLLSAYAYALFLSSPLSILISL